MTDFHDEYVDAKTFLDCQEAFQVTHSFVFSINNMSDKELRESIVNDILCVTMWEKQFNKTIHFGFTKLMRFIPRYMHKRVLQQMKHQEICNLIVDTKSNGKSELRIRDERAILQAAMYYAGFWFTGYDIPKTGNIISVDHSRIEELGGINTAAELISNQILASEMDEKANVPLTNTVN